MAQAAAEQLDRNLLLPEEYTNSVHRITYLEDRPTSSTSVCEHDNLFAWENLILDQLGLTHIVVTVARLLSGLTPDEVTINPMAINLLSANAQKGNF